MNLLREYIREALETRPARMKLGMSIPPDLRMISDMFRSAGEELYIVGGAVRDTLLNKTPKDYDLATGAAPEAVIDIVSNDPSNKVDLTGKSFGVVRVWTPEGNEYEIATFRKDIGSGRRPDAVEFTSIEDDVKRRDLTINALFYDMDSGEVVDYVGGIEDIKSGVVKAVGDPMQRFQEDKLRILRAARFAARLGSDLDPETEAAILSDNDLADVSPDRIRDEVVKGITTAQNVGHFLELLRNLDLYDQIFPGLQVDQNTSANTKDTPVQLALMLGANNPNQVKSVLKGMKYSNDEVATVIFLMKFPEITKDSAPAMKKEFNRIKMDPGRLQEFAPAANVSQKTVNSFLEFTSAPPAASPRDLMSQGLKGPEIGIAMQSAESDAYDRMLGQLREYVSCLIREETHTFHGYNFGPGAVGLPGPQFSDSAGVTDEDTEAAAEWLEEYDPTELVAFSRGSAVLHQMMQDHPEMVDEVPTVTYVSPAALRKWTGAGVQGSPAGSTVIHSIGDNVVPLKQACQIATQVGSRMIAVPGKADGKDHVRALKYRSGGGVDIDAGACAADKKLPNWGQDGNATPEELEKQMKRGKELINAPTEELEELMIREYIQGLLMEQEAKFSGILKLMPAPAIVSNVSSLLQQLPPEAVPLPEDKLHVTLAHQGVLKPYRKQLKQLSKEGMLPPPPPAILDVNVEERADEELGRKSWVVWVRNQADLKAYVQDVIQLVGGPPGDPEPSRHFHISIANLTGNPGDSVR